MPLAEAVATSRCVTSTWTKAVCLSTLTWLRRTRARAVGLPLEVHVVAFQGTVQARALVQRRQAGVDTALTCALLPGAARGSLARDASPSLVEVMAWPRQGRKSECCLSAASDRPRRGGGTLLPVAALVRGHD